MKIKKVAMFFIYSLIISLLLFAFLGENLLFFAKLFALSIALTLLYAIYLRKSSYFVEKGEEVIAIGGVRYLIGKKGIALTKAKVNSKIRIKFYDGKEAEGIVERTEGLFSPALVRIVYEEELIK